MSHPGLRLLGVSAGAEVRRVTAGEWERPTRRTVRLAGSTPSPEQHLMIAVLETGPAAVASHQSAAWLWKLADLSGAAFGHRRYRVLAECHQALARYGSGSAGRLTGT